MNFLPSSSRRPANYWAIRNEKLPRLKLCLDRNDLYLRLVCSVFFALSPAPVALFMGHEQYNQANEQ